MNARGGILHVALDCLSRAIGGFGRKKVSGGIRTLSELDDHLLDDIGLTRSQAGALDKKFKPGHPVSERRHSAAAQTSAPPFDLRR